MAASADQLVRSIGLILNNAAVYGTAHPVTGQSIRVCFELFQQAWTVGDIDFNLSESGLTVQHATVDLKNRLSQNFVEHLEARAISHFFVKPGMTLEQFQAFIEVLVAKPRELEQLDGFVGAVAAVGLADVVVARKVVYMEVADNQTVVDKNKLEVTGPPGDRSGEGGGDADAAGAIAEASAFLRSDAGVSASGAEAVRRIAADAAQLAELILHAANLRAAAPAAGAGKEALGDVLAECLWRTYQAMTGVPRFNTQKAKKQIQRTLASLERDLLRQLPALGEPVDAAAAEAVKEAVESITDDLTLDALAQEYTGKRQAISASEQRILRYLRRKQADDPNASELRQRLTAGGLDDQEWLELVVKSRATMPVTAAANDSRGSEGDGPGGRSDGVNSEVVKPLDALLMKLQADALANQGEQAPMGHAATALPPRISAETLKQDLHAVQVEVEHAIRRATESIDKLVVAVSEEDFSADKALHSDPPRMSRKHLLEIMAEIGQELCQPLTVISCSIDMIRTGNLGEVTALQQEMLSVSAENGHKLKTLIDRFVGIVGMPRGFGVDKEIQSSLYVQTAGSEAPGNQALPGQ